MIILYTKQTWLAAGMVKASEMRCVASRYQQGNQPTSRDGSLVRESIPVMEEEAYYWKRQTSQKLSMCTCKKSPQEKTDCCVLQLDGYSWFIDKLIDGFLLFLSLWPYLFSLRNLKWISESPILFLDKCFFWKYLSDASHRLSFRILHPFTFCRCSHKNRLVP